MSLTCLHCGSLSAHQFPASLRVTQSQMDLEELTYRVSPVLRLTLIVVLVLLFTDTPVAGQFKVIGSPQPIVVAPGDDVLLPCHVEPQVDVSRRTVEWSRLDVQPDPNDRLSSIDYVHLYRETSEDTDMQLLAYAGRTTLFKESLRQGNISLRIVNVTLADNGKYRCFIPKLKSETKSSVVSLVVDPNFAKTWTTETPLQTRSLQTLDPTEGMDVNGSSQSTQVLIVASCVLLVLAVGGVVAVCLKRKCQKQQHEELPTV